jgi:hypothetical protein
MQVGCGAAANGCVLSRLLDPPLVLFRQRADCGGQALEPDLSGVPRMIQPAQAVPPSITSPAYRLDGPAVRNFAKIKASICLRSTIAAGAIPGTPQVRSGPAGRSADGA